MRDVRRVEGALAANAAPDPAAQQGAIVCDVREDPGAQLARARPRRRHWSRKTVLQRVQAPRPRMPVGDSWSRPHVGG